MYLPEIYVLHAKYAWRYWIRHWLAKRFLICKDENKAGGDSHPPPHYLCSFNFTWRCCQFDSSAKDTTENCQTIQTVCRMYVCTSHVPWACTRMYPKVSGSENCKWYQLSATRCSCIAILWVSLVSFAAITLCVAFQRVFIVVGIYFFIDSVRKLLDTPSYSATWSTDFHFVHFGRSKQRLVQDE